MSLWPIKTVTGIINYLLYDGRPLNPIWDNYGHWLITPPRTYEESLNRFLHFFYEPSNDRLVAYGITDQIHWPGWGSYRYEWSADTGELISKSNAGVISSAWCGNATSGSYNKLFATWNSSVAFSEIDWNTLGWQSPMFSMNPSVWNPSRIFRHVVVNLQDHLVVGIQDYYLEVWDISGTPTLRGVMRLPNSLGYMCMESREICWVITRDGLILKANYQNNPPRWEMLSSVQNPSPDATNYFIAWDQKRGRLAVLRQRPDAEDGACQCQFEFYRPLVKVLGMTDPVPVQRHRAGDITEFVAHLYGSSGEGISPYRVTASLQAPADGILLQAESLTTQNGGVSFLYQGPAAAGEDTLILEAIINDGET